MANPTTNFGWVMPTSTSLVTNLPADFNTFGQGVDTSMAQLKGGTTGQILSKTSATDMAFTWITNDVGDITAVTAGTGISGGGTSGAVTVTNSMATAITTAGDLIKGTGSGTFDRLGIGSSGQVLTVTAGAPAWATPSSGSTFSGVYCRNSASQSIANNTYTAITLDTEVYDVGGYHSNVTNNTRFTIPSGKAGYYQIAFGGYYPLNATGARNIVLYKNGSSFMAATIPGNSSVYSTLNISVFSYLDVGDYLEFYTVQSSGGSISIDVTTAGGAGYAQMFLIGA